MAEAKPVRAVATILCGLFAVSPLACDDAVTTGPDGSAGGGGGSSMGSGSSQSNVLESAQLGNPHLISAQRLAFGPGGVLLIGDGRSDRIVAVETGDTSSAAREENAFTRIDNISGLAADVIGNNVTAAELQIDDIAVNPLSWRTYIAVTQFSTFEAHVLWVDADGDLRLFDLENVVHATVDVPPNDGSAGTITDLVWTDEHVIGSVTPQTFLRHELAYVDTPFAHQGKVRHATTRIFHRAWGQWITEQPMDHFFSYNHGGELFVVGSFTSTVARFVSADLEDGASDALGTTVFDLMDGRSVLDFVSYERDDQMYAVALVSNFLFDGEPGALRIDGELFRQTSSINDESPILVDFSGNPLVSGVERAYDLDLAQRIAPRGDAHAIVLRANSLFTEELP